MENIKIKLPEGAQTFLVNGNVVTIYGRYSGTILANWRVKKEELKTVVNCLQNQLGAICNETEKFKKERTKLTREKNRIKSEITYEVYETQKIALCDFKKFINKRGLSYDDFMITSTIITDYNGNKRKTFTFKKSDDVQANMLSKVGTGIKGNLKFDVNNYENKFVTKYNFKMAIKRSKKYKFEDFIIIETKEILSGESRLGKYKFKYIGSEV